MSVHEGVAIGAFGELMKREFDVLDPINHRFNQCFGTSCLSSLESGRIIFCDQSGLPATPRHRLHPAGYDAIREATVAMIKNAVTQEDFILDIRRAVGLVSPAVKLGAGSISSRELAGDVARAAIWLTPKTVEAFNPADFSQLPTKQFADLCDAVQKFKTIAAQIPSNQKASDDQFREGLSRFYGLQSVVRSIVLDEWESGVKQLIDEAQSWASSRAWECRRSNKTIQEKLLDSYEAPQLFIHASGANYLLAPVARFVPRGLGMVDLSIIPSYHSVMVVRTSDGWFLHLDTSTDVNGVERIRWTADAFFRAIEWLGKRE